MQSNLFAKIQKQENADKIIIAHCLEGYAYTHGNNSDLFKRTWQSQLYQNTIKYSELEKLKSSFKKIEVRPILLKGMSISKDLFEDLGERSMSDIDILVPDNKFDLVVTTLESAGYKVIKAPKWKANKFKTVMQKKIDLAEIVIEIHSKIFYTAEFTPETLRDFDGTYKKLSFSDEFFHLMAHLSFQHTFLYLHWLIDIELYYLKFQKELHFQRIFTLAKEHQCEKSIAATLFCLKEYCRIEISTEVQDYIDKKLPKILQEKLDFDFLLDPHKNKMSYYHIKHLLKDTYKQSLEYNILWLGAKINGLMGRR